MAAPLVTLLTDFGAADYFAGAMKGALLAVCPAARVFDVSHGIPPHDIAAGAFTLLAAHDSWPAGAIHVAVVDPGVGSARRALLVAAGGYFFVGPDNGLFSYIYELYPDAAARHITNERFFRQPVSPSFHGRDVFAPVAGALGKGARPDQFGPVVTDLKRLPSFKPQPQPDGQLVSRVIHIDRFGNCVTGFARRDWPAAAQSFRLTVNNCHITRLCHHFAESNDDAPFAIWGSAGLLEISVNGASAAKALGVGRGDEARLSFA
jgi:hypothetical protein